MRVTQSLFASPSWVIIAPLCSLLRVGTQGWLQDLVTHALATSKHGYLSTPCYQGSEPPEAAQQSVLGSERVVHFAEVTQRLGKDTAMG